MADNEPTTVPLALFSSTAAFDRSMCVGASLTSCTATVMACVAERAPSLARTTRS